MASERNQGAEAVQDVELQDGGVIEAPDDDGTIRRRDVFGNLEQVWESDDPEYRKIITEFFPSYRLQVFRCFFDDPRYVDIEATSLDKAREQFMAGNFDDSFSDPEGCIEEPRNIILMGDIPLVQEPKRPSLGPTL